MPLFVVAAMAPKMREGLYVTVESKARLEANKWQNARNLDEWTGRRT